MTPDILIGLLAGLLIASVFLNAALWYTRRENTRVYRERARAAEDARKATELRSGAQIDAMLDRISTAPRLAMAAAVPPVDGTKPKYISDEPYMDEAWNEYRGVVEDEAETE